MTVHESSWQADSKTVPDLIFEFDEEFTEIFMVKGKALFPKIY